MVCQVVSILFMSSIRPRPVGTRNVSNSRHTILCTPSTSTFHITSIKPKQAHKNTYKCTVISKGAKTEESSVPLGDRGISLPCYILRILIKGYEREHRFGIILVLSWK
jgi:hypothetical protein